jgi:2-polyprenyl-6-methoxyphenol hydroxylase-like FAD-dependent oxidoreductase
MRETTATKTVIHADVGIIGAGPAGLATAVHLGQLGIDRVVIVDRAYFPRDKTCGSAISPKGCKILEALGVGPSVTQQSYAIAGMRLVTPRGHDAIMSSPQDVAAGLQSSHP